MKTEPMHPRRERLHPDDGGVAGDLVPLHRLKAPDYHHYSRPGYHGPYRLG